MITDFKSVITLIVPAVICRRLIFFLGDLSSLPVNSLSASLDSGNGLRELGNFEKLIYDIGILGSAPIVIVAHQL